MLQAIVTANQLLDDGSRLVQVVYVDATAGTKVVRDFAFPLGTTRLDATAAMRAGAVHAAAGDLDRLPLGELDLTALSVDPAIAAKAAFVAGVSRLGFAQQLQAVGILAADDPIVDALRADLKASFDRAWL